MSVQRLFLCEVASVAGVAPALLRHCNDVGAKVLASAVVVLLPLYFPPPFARLAGCVSCSGFVVSEGSVTAVESVGPIVPCLGRLAFCSISLDDGQVYIRHLAAHLSTKYGYRVVTKNWRGIGLELSTRRCENPRLWPISYRDVAISVNVARTTTPLSAPDFFSPERVLLRCKPTPTMRLRSIAEAGHPARWAVC